MSKLLTYPVDPRDRWNNDTEYDYRWCLDDWGRNCFARPPENEYEALMECQPGEEPHIVDLKKRDEVRQAMATLTDDEYDVLCSGMTIREYADATGISKSTVLRRLNAAKAKAAACLEEAWTK